MRVTVGHGIRPILVSLLPNYRDIEVEGDEERLPYLGNSEFFAWQQIPEGVVHSS